MSRPWRLPRRRCWRLPSQPKRHPRPTNPPSAPTSHRPVSEVSAAATGNILNMLDAVLQDARYAIRALRSSGGFAAVAILSLALGIGANTAIFSLIDAVILKSLPVSHPEELLQVMMGAQSY